MRRAPPPPVAARPALDGGWDLVDSSFGITDSIPFVPGRRNAASPGGSDSARDRRPPPGRRPRTSPAIGV
ncbi:hypothetical protein FRAHR75_440052 [Frankia sp. Hr75.2]|nr:hypothetical protein FRAHR75_440052 [Frankia sp. Hr75.2]